MAPSLMSSDAEFEMERRFESDIELAHQRREKHYITYPQINVPYFF